MTGLAWLAEQWFGVHSPRPGCSACDATRRRIGDEVTEHHRRLLKKLRAK